MVFKDGIEGETPKPKKYKKHDHHHHKEKKIKRESGFNEDLDESLMMASSIKREDLDSNPAGVSEASKAALKKLLDLLLQQLQKKDTDGHFARPADPALFPGYYQMIKEPMDFGTMRIKLNADKYSTLAAFRFDFEKICHNTCNYECEDSDLFKFSQRLLMDGQKHFSEDQIRQLLPQAPYMKLISKAELGFELSNKGSDDEEEDAVVDSFRKTLHSSSQEEVTPQVEVAERQKQPFQDLLNHARAAARGAADRLRIYKAKSRMGFVRSRDDGSTSLGLLTGASALMGGERPISLGALIGRVKQGTGSLQGYREDRRNLCKAVYPLYYGAYSSHGPSYDSTFATMTKEESDLVCNDVDVTTLESITKFSKSVDYSTFIADHLLDILTDNEHRTATNYLEEEKRLKDEEAKLFGSASQPAKVAEVEASEASESEDEPAKVDFESLKSLSDVGIDVSFLESLQQKYEETSDGHLDSLADTAGLISELKEVQLERLSAALPLHLSQIAMPNDHEMALASQIQNNLLEMAKQVTPGDVVPHEAVRRALGISIDVTERRKNYVKVVEKVTPDVVTVQDEPKPELLLPGMLEVPEEETEVVVEPPEPSAAADVAAAE